MDHASSLPMASAGGPITAAERIATLDIVRGFALWGKVGPALGLGLAFAIFFIIQVPLSGWWLRRYEYGPLEYIWRTLTYGRRPTLRIRADATAAARPEPV